MFESSTLYRLPDGTHVVASSHLWPVDGRRPGHGLAMLRHAASGAEDGQPIGLSPEGNFEIPGQPVAWLEGPSLIVCTDLADAADLRALGMVAAI